MIKSLLSEEKGQSMVLVAIFLTALIGIAGLAIDGGRLYLAKSEIQKAVDAGSLAGASALKEHFETNNDFNTISQLDADKVANAVGKPIAEKNSTISYNPEPTVDFAKREENEILYEMQGETTVKLFLMPIFHMNSSKVAAYARAKIEQETLPNWYQDVIPIGMEVVPDKNNPNPINLTELPGQGNSGNYNLLDFSLLEDEVDKCNGSGSGTPDIAGYFENGSPKPITVGQSVCTRNGKPVKSTPIEEAIIKRIEKGKIVYVLHTEKIVLDEKNGKTEIDKDKVRVIGFYKFELKPVTSNTIQGIFIGEVSTDELTSGNSTYTSKLDY